MNMTVRHYNPKRDREAVHRIWYEIGWLDEDEAKRGVLDTFLTSGDCWVSELDGDAECMVLIQEGRLRYQHLDLPFLSVGAVATSRVARKQGIATDLTAHAIAGGVEKLKPAVAGLGMFEQGFYDRLGFGTGSYETYVGFPPSQLKVQSVKRAPKRLGQSDWEAMHANRMERRCSHGAVSILHAGATAEPVLRYQTGFGLGYFDGPDGRLSHHIWINRLNNAEHGPYEVGWLSYQTSEQLLELLGVLKNLGDQVRTVFMYEPVGFQIQVLLKNPFFFEGLSRGSKFESRRISPAWWQIRICDLKRCVEGMHLRGETSSFNLELSDPIATKISPEESWSGVAGSYQVTLGPESTLATGSNPVLPTLRASVNAFSRLWLGVSSASSLAVSDGLEAPESLLAQLDDLIQLPTPRVDWDF